MTYGWFAYPKGFLPDWEPDEVGQVTIAAFTYNESNASPRWNQPGADPVKDLKEWIAKAKEAYATFGRALTNVGKSMSGISQPAIEITVDTSRFQEQMGRLNKRLTGVLDEIADADRPIGQVVQMEDSPGEFRVWDGDKWHRFRRAIPGSVTFTHVNPPKLIDMNSPYKPRPLQKREWIDEFGNTHIEFRDASEDRVPQR